MQTKERNSSLELLRIFCIIGIVIMHTCGPMMNEARGVNLIWVQLENGLFQAGVSIFILISGYFGIKTSFERVIKFEMKVWSYSVVSGIIIFLVVDDSLIRMIKSVLPIITNKYWFLTGYMLLMLFAPFINKAISSMNKSMYERLLIIMFCVFFVIPTILYFDILGDNGKNIINMIFMYMLGGYLRRYPISLLSSKKVLLLILCVTYTVAFALNTGISVIGKEGAHCPMSRDCSTFIVVEAVIIFILFQRLKIQSRLINGIAKHVMATYMLESLIRKLIDQYVFQYTKYYGEFYWFIVSILIAVITVVICICIDYLYDVAFSKSEDRFIKVMKECNLYKKVSSVWDINL